MKSTFSTPASKTGAKLRPTSTSAPHVRGVAPRIEFYGMVSNGMKSVGLHGKRRRSRRRKQSRILRTACLRHRRNLSSQIQMVKSKR